MKVKLAIPFVLAATTTAALAVTAPARALDLDAVTARVRAIYIEPADKSDAIAALSAPKDTLDVQSKWAPDIDFEYAVNPNVGVELLLTIPQKHTVIARQTALGNNVNLGSVTHLPPTITAKYYFLTDKFRPYVGGGLNVTWFTKNDLGLKLDIDRWSFGPALQAGFDVSLNDKLSLSFDAKRAWISTDVSLNGAKLTTVKVDPWIIGVGLGYRLGK
jgi:outer membrane protein